MNTPSHPTPASADACIEQRIQREAQAAARIYGDLNHACPYPFGSAEGKLFKQHFLNALSFITVKVPDLTDLPGAVITGYHRNTAGRRGVSSDGQMYAYGRCDRGYFICDQLGWTTFRDFTEIARALQAAADAGGAL